MSTRAKPNTATWLIRRAKFYFSTKNIFTKEDRQFRLGWKGILSFIALGLLVGWLLAVEGRFDLGRPVLAALGSIYMILKLRWRLRNYVWFWATLFVFFTLYSVLIFTVKWDNQGPSRGIIGGLMVISVYLIFVILHAFESRLKQAPAITTEHTSHAAIKNR